MDPPLLVFDEPTSAMDAGGEERLIQRLRPALPGKTLLLVTHRTSLLTLVDRVLVLERGRLLADGPRDLVLAALREGRLHGG
jgi:ATP-binding cassette subfamily C protein LapB